MNIQRRGRGRKLIASLVLVALITAAFTGGIFFLHDHFDELIAKKPDTPPELQLFSFVDTPGWWRGTTSETSMAVSESNDTHDCFISIEYKRGTVNATASLKNIQQKLARNGNYTMNQLGTVALTLHTVAGPKSYELHQFSIVTPNDAEKVKEGQEFGYVQLAHGYVALSGYCDLSNQLVATIPALKAIQLNGK